MRRIIILGLMALSGLGVAACSGTTDAHDIAQAQCQTMWTDAQKWAKDFTADMPSPPSAAEVEKLAEADYKAAAASKPDLDCVLKGS